MTSERARVGVGLCVFVSLWALLAGPALADGKSEARKRLAEGTALYRRGDYRGALERFEEAQALFPSPRIYFNIGQAQSRLGKHAAAVQAFESFLAEASDASAARRRDAQRFLTELRPRVGWVRITAPSGSEVSVDGRSVGVAPLANALPVDPGVHQLTARSPGAAVALVHRVDVAAGQTAVWEAAPEPSPAIPPTMAPASGSQGPTATAPPAPTSVPLASAAPAATGAPVDLKSSPPPPAAATPPRRWWPWVVGGAVVVTGAVAAALLLGRDPASPTGSLGSVDMRMDR